MRHKRRLTGITTQVVQPQLRPPWPFKFVVAMLAVFVGCMIVIDRWFWIIRIAGSSMAPTIFEGDVVVALKRPAGGTRVQRHDVVVARPSERAGLIIKRVIGLPGESVTWNASSVRLDDGAAAAFGLLTDSKGGSHQHQCRIPDHHYFLVGDNSQHTVDSRMFGPLPSALLEGRVWLRLWPTNCFGRIH
jgi:signal peptidase I